jgi:hypothetical protein
LWGPSTSSPFSLAFGGSGRDDFLRSSAPPQQLEPEARLPGARFYSCASGVHQHGVELKVAVLGSS